MTQIDAASQLAALIRRQMAAARPSAKGVRKTTTASALDATRQAEEQDAQSAPGNNIASAVALRVQSIDPDDPQRERKAFRMFLDAVLLAEFGEQLINDPGFYQLVEQVHQQMEADSELLEAIHQAAATLLGLAGS